MANDQFNFNPAPNPGSNPFAVKTNTPAIAQSVRKKSYGAAKGWLIFAGILMMLNAGLEFATTDKQIQDELNKQIAAAGGPRNVDQAEVEKVRKQLYGFVYIFVGALAAIGFSMCVLGFFVNKAPVMVTAAGLILFLCVHGGLALIEPATLLGGIVFKVMIFAGLVGAVKAAAEYEKEEKRLADRVAYGET